jgi:aminoglycoside 6'-N-acetyltransferase
MPAIQSGPYPTMSDPAFSFRSITAMDLELLRAWLEVPHVRRWWRTGWTDPILQGFENGAAIPEGMDACIFEVDGRPVGYIRGYWAVREPSRFWQAIEGVTNATRGIDFLIGEADLVNRKLGRVMIRAFVVRQFENQSVDRIVAAPGRDNWPANIALKRVGFRDRGRIDRPGVNAMLLTLARAVFKS